MQELLEVVGSNPAQGTFFLYFNLKKKHGLRGYGFYVSSSFMGMGATHLHEYIKITIAGLVPLFMNNRPIKPFVHKQ